MTIAADLLGLTPPERHRFLADQPEDDVALILAAGRREYGSEWWIFRDDPQGFVADGLGEYDWSKQAEIAQSLVTHRRTAVPSGSGVGKTWLCGRLVAWWIAVHPPGDAKCVTTSTTFKQVRNLLWPHIRKIADRHDLPGRRNQVEWVIDNDVVAWGFKPSEYDEAAVQGVHCPHLLIVVDEAGGIPSTLGRSLESLMTGEDTRLIAIGNPPTDAEASWFETICASPYWNTIPISAYDSPNFTGEPCPPEVARELVDERWVNEQIEQWGADDPYVLAKVHAQFCKTSSRRVIPVAWAEAAIANDEPGTSGWQRLGVDVAGGGGDEMVVALADGWKVSIAETWSGAASIDQVVNAERVAEHIVRAQAVQARSGYTDHRPRVKVDATGIGAGTADVLARMGKDGKHDGEIVHVRVGESATNKGRFVARRDECWWTLREVCRDNTIRLQIADRELKQLTAPTFTDHTHGGRVKVESKDDLRRRGFPSPDRADAICLAIYEPTPVVAAAAYASQILEARFPRKIGGRPVNR